MSYIIRDNQPQKPDEVYFVGKRHAKAPNGQVVEIADFGPISKSHKFRDKNEACSYADFLNKVARRMQFDVEKFDDTQPMYGVRDFSRGKFKGFEKMSVKPMRVADPVPSKSDWVEASEGNGFTAEDMTD